VGGAALRSGALSDDGVIALVNDAFIPVWIDVRTTPLPPLPIWPQVLLKTQLGVDRRVVDLFSQGFFLRSLVLTPDGQTLLNPQADTVTGSIATSSEKGYYAYAQTKPQDYQVMLQGALVRFRALARR
jgi:hypothetical protein